MNSETDKKLYNLEERTFEFSKKVLSFCRTLPQDVITKPLINQLVKSSTSIGANYTEANGGSSKKDFINKVFICKKEAKETMYWLRLVITLFHDKQDQIAPLFQESKELFFIFSKICSSSRKGEDIKN